MFYPLIIPGKKYPGGQRQSTPIPYCYVNVPSFLRYRCKVPNEAEKGKGCKNFFHRKRKMLFYTVQPTNQIVERSATEFN